MRKKFSHVVLALTVVLALGTATSRQPKPGAAALLPALPSAPCSASASPAPTPVPATTAPAGPGLLSRSRQCQWVGRSCWTNRYGEHVCSGGDWRCWRPTICD